MRRRTFINNFKFAVIIISLFCIFQCSHDNDKTEDGIFDIYLIHDSELNILEFDATDIESIDLPDNPVTTICDIDTYKIFQSESGLSLTHSIVFKSEMKDKFGYSNCYFVLVVNGIRMYKGEYWANFMDTMLQNVLIYAYREKEFHIMTLDDGIEQINDSRIINTLITNGVNVIYKNTGT
jgi:hypothetical protein